VFQKKAKSTHIMIGESVFEWGERGEGGGGRNVTRLTGRSEYLCLFFNCRFVRRFKRLLAPGCI
jgi:hypothetical protein